ncbi:MAG: ABC transporter ATP-binding protein [Asticcacaulis sp.]|uniref:ABC transporter ATP-binding protein n=1 Tax=Asticcacaulis sp. TaxID=1872648 RepID=UPI0039E5EBC4
MGITKRFYSEGKLRVIPTLGYALIDRSLQLRSKLYACFVLEGAVIGLGMTGPIALKLLIDSLADRRTSLPWAGLLVVVFIVGSLGGGILSAARRRYSQQIIDRLNEAVVDDTLKVAMPRLAGPHEEDSGRILGMMERLPFSLQVLIEGLVWQIIPVAVQVALSLAIIGDQLKPLYVLVLAVTLAGYVFATWYSSGQQQAVSRDVLVESNRVSQTLADILRNARRVVLNGALPTERRLVRDQLTDCSIAFGGMLLCQLETSLLQYGVAGLGLTGLLILSANDVLAGQMTVGDFVLLQAYAFRLVLPLSGFGFVISQTALAFLDVRELLQMGGEAEEAGTYVGLPANTGASVELTDVTFSYGLGLPGLHDVSVTLVPGTFNVIVGRNGSGKSTLAQIMAGILQPASGEVRIGGVPLQTVPAADRHRYLLYVPQTITLFNRTLLENALYPPTTQSEAELIRVLNDWRFYDPGQDIDLTIGVGEQGERLSGGQRQKLELARIAHVRVPVIILDESTSALDPGSEADIIRALRRGYAGATTLILITHRVGLAEMADQVLFMKNGTLARAGPHETLMADSAAYARLWGKPPGG